MPRMKFGEFEFEGSVAELAALKKALEGESPRPSAPLAYRSHSTDGFVDEAQAHQIINRRPLSSEQITVLATLARAGEEWVPATVLQKKLKYSKSEFAGLMGAFGRRISFTQGIGNRKFFDQQWDVALGCNRYRLPPSVRAAVKSSALDLIA